MIKSVIPITIGSASDVDTSITQQFNLLKNSRIVGSRHSKGIEAVVAESYIAPVDFEMNNQQVKKGSWVLVVKVDDPEEWKKVKNGVYNGFSVGGYGRRQPS